ncbi:glucose-6-phosphate dehydrogenase [Candidatus Berkelbacteria bacterium]|nr:glucose-6-phosphate dehydrogenase [Candidatus Berkelbacteria bacterium]
MTGAQSKPTPPKLSPGPTILVIFGATGDLMAKKIAPALAYLEQAGELPAQFTVVGVGRRNLTDDVFREQVRESIHHRASSPTKTLGADFFERFVYHRGEFDDEATYAALAERLGRTDRTWRACADKLFYLAVPPELVEGIVGHLHASGLTDACADETGWTRVILEKPFGRDLASSEALDRLVGQLFKEEQLYRIDHYLGKDVLQNILNFRFANRLFESSWQVEAIERIEIRLLETLGVEDRGPFYDGVGALRDVGQNHLLEMLALVTMDAPQSLAAADIRAARAKLLADVRTPNDRDVKTGSVRAQYDRYRSIEGVAPESQTETYFKLRLAIESDRWRGVNVELEAGKRLGSVDKAVVVTFRHPEPCLCLANQHVRNSVEFRLEPDPAIIVHFWAKSAGLGNQFEPKQLTFSLADEPGRVQYVAEYAQLLLDCIAGDQTSFVATEELRQMWRIVDPFVVGWSKNATPLRRYPPDSDEIRTIATKQLEGRKE